MSTRRLCCIFEDKPRTACILQASCDLSAVRWVCWRGQSVCAVHPLLFKCFYTERPARTLSPPPSLAGLFDQTGARTPSRHQLTSAWEDSEVTCEVSKAKLVFTLLLSRHLSAEVTKEALFVNCLWMTEPGQYPKHPAYWCLLCWHCSHFSSSIEWTPEYVFVISIITSCHVRSTTKGNDTVRIDVKKGGGSGG